MVEKLGGVDRGKTTIGIYCMREEKIKMRKIKNKNAWCSSKGQEFSAQLTITYSSVSWDPTLCSGLCGHPCAQRHTDTNTNNHKYIINKII